MTKPNQAAKLAHFIFPALAFLPLSSLAAPSGAGNLAVNLYIAGDIADCRTVEATQSQAKKTADLIVKYLAQDPQAKVLTLGDNTYPKGTTQEFTECYAPTWGQFKEQTYPSPGNHDYLTPNAEGYFRYFGNQAGEGQRGYYQIRINNWRIFSLNSNLKNAEQAAQLAWLKKELADSPKTCTLAYWHHPVFSSGGHGNDGRMVEVWKVLQAANADIVLSGHDHHYERFAPQTGNGTPDPSGIREFVVGTGGTALYPVLMRRPNSQAVNNTNYGVLQLALRDNGYDWAFLSVDKDSFIDKGSANCH